MTTSKDITGAQIRSTSLADISTIARLHARVFGPGRFSRTAYRVREGAPHVSRFCRHASVDGEVVAAVSFTEIEFGARPNALLLGPLAVAPEVAGRGLGRKLITAGLEQAGAQGIAIVLLVGDEPYYARFGFSRVPAGQIQFPGPVDINRILAWQAHSNAIEEYAGMVKSARQR